jgi:transcriptional regulator with XRE-family HTH domain
MQKLVRDIITRSNKSKSALAGEIGVERMTLHNWLKGRTSVVSKAHQLRIRQVAKKYGVKISD